MNDIKRFIRFSFIGGSMLIIDNLIIFFAISFDHNFILFRSLSFTLTFLLSYFLNCKITFNAKPDKENFIFFIFGSGFLQFLSYTLSTILIIMNFNPLLAVNFGAFLIYIINFYYQKWLFKKK